MTPEMEKKLFSWRRRVHLDIILLDNKDPLEYISAYLSFTDRYRDYSQSKKFEIYVFIRYFSTFWPPNFQMARSQIIF
jgi:hypothetical protein